MGFRKGMSKEVIILIGNIGTGKTTFAQKYVKKGYIIIARDQLRYGIGNGTYIFNRKYERTIWKTELYLYRKFVDLGVNLLIDEVGISKFIRGRYIPYAKKHNYKVTGVVMPHLDMNEAVNRRMNNPHQQDNKKLWEGIYTKFEAMYEKPTKKEGFDKIIYLKWKRENKPIATNLNIKEIEHSLKRICWEIDEGMITVEQVSMYLKRLIKKGG